VGKYNSYQELVRLNLELKAHQEATEEGRTTIDGTHVDCAYEKITGKPQSSWKKLRKWLASVIGGGIASSAIVASIAELPSGSPTKVFILSLTALFGLILAFAGY
jgi:hypothetical protein